MSPISRPTLAGLVLLGLCHIACAAPGDTAEPWANMSAAKFAAMPDGAGIRLGSRIVTKGEIMALVRQTAARSSAPARPSNLAGLRAKIRQEHATAVNTQNARLQAAYRAQPVTLDPPDSHKRANEAPVVPTVSTVEGVAQNGSVLLIKGKGFGDKRGVVRLPGNFPGGSLPLQITADMWSDRAILAIVDIPAGGAMAQDNLALTVTSASGIAGAPGGSVRFVPEMEVADYDWLAATANCSKNGVWDGCGASSASTYTTTHFGFPDGSTYGGTDVVSYNLKNGWTVLSGPTSEVIGCLDAVPPANTSGAFVAGNGQISFQWSIQTTKEAGPTEMGSLVNYCVQSRHTNMVVTGPKGFPYR